jgi:hypothetical protein
VEALLAAAFVEWGQPSLINHLVLLKIAEFGSG